MTKPDWALVTALRELGGRITRSRLASILTPEQLADQIEAFARRGYVLTLTARGTLLFEKWPRRIFAEEISFGLGTDVVGTSIDTHWTVPSTNDLARSEAERGREGTVIFAEEQARGRGRFGRKWIAPRFSSLLFSVALGAPSALRPEALALAGAVAVAESVVQLFGLPARIKWPNDVLIEGRKISGVLVETIAPQAGERWFVAGVGINVNLDLDSMPRELRETAGSISHFLGRHLDRALLARTVLRRLDFWWEVLKAGDTARLSGVSRNLSSLIGTFVTIESRGKRHRGRVLDVDVDEGLVLQLGGGPAKPFPPGEATIIQ